MSDCEDLVSSLIPIFRRVLSSVDATTRLQIIRQLVSLHIDFSELA